MRKIKWLLACLTIVLVAGAGNAGASSGAGRLDLSFGGDGKVLPASAPSLQDTAMLPDRRVVVAGVHGLVALLPSGKIDRGFGEDGWVRLATPPEAQYAYFEDVLVDSAGRIVVVGICDFSVRTGVHDLIETEYLPREIMVQRYTPDGKPDPSFGGGDGTVLTDFGLPAARPDLTPHLFLSRAALDRQDRVLVTGRRRADGYREEAFIGRLTEAGDDDRSFGANGSLELSGYRWVYRPVADPENGVFVIAARGYRSSSLLHFEENGEPDPGFGENGGRPVSAKTTLAHSILPQPGGETLFARELLPRPGRQLPYGVQVRRLGVDGSLDRDIGSFRIPRLGATLLRNDNEGGILVAFALHRGFERIWSWRERPSELALLRLHPDGTRDLEFGQNGITRITFGGLNQRTHLVSFELEGDLALIGGMRCLKGGSPCRPALARVELGSG